MNTFSKTTTRQASPAFAGTGCLDAEWLDGQAAEQCSSCAFPPCRAPSPQRYLSSPAWVIEAPCGTQSLCRWVLDQRGRQLLVAEYARTKPGHLSWHKLGAKRFAVLAHDLKKNRDIFGLNALEVMTLEATVRVPAWASKRMRATCVDSARLGRSRRIQSTSSGSAAFA